MLAALRAECKREIVENAGPGAKGAARAAAVVVERVRLHQRRWEFAQNWDIRRVQFSAVRRGVADLRWVWRAGPRRAAIRAPGEPEQEPRAGAGARCGGG
jgi:hypothetical protein